MAEIQLKRSGKRPIVFVGEEVAHLSDQEPGSKRWTVIRVYKLSEGGFVVGIGKMTLKKEKRKKEKCHNTKLESSPAPKKVAIDRFHQHKVLPFIYARLTEK